MKCLFQHYSLHVQNFSSPKISWISFFILFVLFFFISKTIYFFNGSKKIFLPPYASFLSTFFKICCNFSKRRKLCRKNFSIFVESSTGTQLPTYYVERWLFSAALYINKNCEIRLDFSLGKCNLHSRSNHVHFLRKGKT